jgi:hypothetical protein
MVEERMYEPYIFGFGAVEVVRNPALSVDTRLKVVAYTLGQTRPMEEYGTPHGLPVLLSFLAEAGRLDMPTFQSVMQIASLEGNIADDWEAAEVRNIADWLIAREDVPEDELLWWLWYISCRCEKPQLGRPLAQHLLDHPVLSASMKSRLAHAWLDGEDAGTPPAPWRALEAMLAGDEEALKSLMPELDLEKLLEKLQEQFPPEELGTPSFGFFRTLLAGHLGGFVLTPAYLKRQALVGLVHLGEDPLDLCRNYLGSQRDYYANAVNQGIAEIIREYRAQIPEPALRQLVEEGLRVGAVATRKSFYQLGADLFGQDYWTRALSDNAGSVREWAAKKIESGAAMSADRQAAASGGRTRRRRSRGEE